MPEPDFEQLAEQLRFRLWGHDRSDADTEARVLSSIAEQLRLVWNARGAADMATVDAHVSWMRDTLTAAAPSITKLTYELRRLDR